MYKLLRRNALGSPPAEEGTDEQAEDPPRPPGPQESPVAAEHLYCELCKVFISDQGLHVQKPRHLAFEHAFAQFYASVLRSVRQSTARPSRVWGIGRRRRRLKLLAKLYFLKL